MLKYVYKITITDDFIFHSSSRTDIIKKINNYYKNDITFKPYTKCILNNVLRVEGEIKYHRGLKSIEKFDMDTFYGAYIEAYMETLSNRNLTHKESVRRLKNTFVNYIDDVVITSLNNNESYDDINNKINIVGLISV